MTLKRISCVLLVLSFFWISSNLNVNQSKALLKTNQSIDDIHPMNQTALLREYKTDTTPPELEVGLTSDMETEENLVFIQGRAYDGESYIESIMINGSEAFFMDYNGEFFFMQNLQVGVNTIDIIATNYINLTTKKTFQITRTNKTSFPDAPSGVLIELWVGKKQAFINQHASEAEAIIMNNRTMVPLRFIAIAFQAEAQFIPEFQQIYIFYHNMIVTLWINKPEAQILLHPDEGDRQYKVLSLDSPPIIRNGFTYVPIRFISEIFGAEVNWISQEQKVTIWNKSCEDNTNQVKGNSDGNLINNGIAAIQDNWVYFILYDCDGGKIYKERPDGTERQFVYEEAGNLLNVVGDWLYYSNSGTLCRLRTDGKYHQIISLFEVNEIHVIGDWIYCTEEGSIWRIRTDGTKKQTIYSGSAYSINIVGDWIYFVSPYYGENWSIQGGGICKIKIDGTGFQMLKKGASVVLHQDGWLYFFNHGDHNRLYKIQTDGSSLRKISQIRFMGYMNIENDWIYFCNADDEESLYKMKIDGTQVQKLNDEISLEIQIIGEWIFYMNRDDEGGAVLCKIRKDGTDRQEIQ